MLLAERRLYAAKQRRCLKIAKQAIERQRLSNSSLFVEKEIAYWPHQSQYVQNHPESAKNKAALSDGFSTFSCVGPTIAISAVVLCLQAEKARAMIKAMTDDFFID